MSQKINIARSFKPKDAFGQPRFFLKDAKEDEQGNILDGQRFLLGSVFGVAEKEVTKTKPNPDGTVAEFKALEGNFEAVPARAELGITRAPQAFLPPHIHAMIANQLNNGAATVGFAFEVEIETKKSVAAGFTWIYNAKIDTQVVDPLAGLRAAALGLPAPEPVAETAALAAPAPLAEENPLADDRADAADSIAQEPPAGNGHVEAEKARAGDAAQSTSSQDAGSKSKGKRAAA